MAGQLRVLSKERSAPGSGTTWRSAVPAEQRALITSLVNDAEEQLTQLRGAQYGKTADAAQQLLGNLGHAATLIEQAVRETAAGALTAGMALEDLARWALLPADVLAEALADHHNEQQAKRAVSTHQEAGSRARAVVRRDGTSAPGTRDQNP